MSNGVPDGGIADTDTNDSKDLVGRLVVKPFTKSTGSPLRGLGLAIAGSDGRQSGAGALPSFKTSSLGQTFFSYSGAVADGIRTRYSPQVFYYYKRFGGWGEYVHTNTPVRKGSIREGIDHDAWQVAGTFVISGEDATEGRAGVRPRHDFDFGHGHYGAFQVAVRYHTLKVDDRAFDLGLAAAGASRKAEAWTLGLDWYLTQYVKYVVNFERTVFDGNAEGARVPENALVFRTQLNF